MQVDGVVRVHNLRLWGLTANKSALSAHLAIGNNNNKLIPQILLFNLENCASANEANRQNKYTDYYHFDLLVCLK